MSRKNPFDELETLLRERRQKRMKFLAKFPSRISRAAHHKWFTYETKVVEKEIKLLEKIVPQKTPEWKSQLARIKKRFENALMHMKKVAEKAQKEMKSVSDNIHKETPPNKSIDQPPLNIAESLLEIWGAASDLEKLVTEVEHEIARTLRQRQLAKRTCTKTAQPVS